MKKYDLLCMLIRSALWGTPLPIKKMPSQVFRAIMNAAEKQTVTGLIAQLLVSNNIKLSKYDAVEALYLIQHASDRNHQINQALIKLTKLLNDNGVNFIVVKGQTLAALYPTPDTRLPGDIDFYCDADNFWHARQVIEKIWDVEYHYDSTDVKQHMAFTHDEVEFEQHLMLCHFSSPTIQRNFDQYLSTAKTINIDIEGQGIPTLEPTLNTLYTFLHLYRHLIGLGCSLRQFCDLALLLHHHRNLIDRNRLAAMLNKIQHTRAFRAVGAILTEHLGLPPEDFPLPITTHDRTHGEALLRIVFQRGNFGKYGRRHAVRSGTGYYLEALSLKLRHYIRFYPLSPKENRALLTRSIPQKIYAAFKRKSSS